MPINPATGSATCSFVFAGPIGTWLTYEPTYSGDANFGSSFGFTSLMSPAQSNYTITTIAGGNPNDISAASANIAAFGISIDPHGNMYIADDKSHVYKLDQNGVISVAAGNGSQYNNSQFGNGYYQHRSYE